ncbi:XdhC family protein [Streptomyces sp. NPDC020983]|uniref:XdhC family protein n=1 Tax=Streptomyces sp. NPDC020983 TaxID=3365106 RepID=UPI0037963326
MLGTAADLHRWCAAGRPFAVATVVAVSGSAPRPPGAALAVDADGTAVGSVSGGCVEADVYLLCQEVLAAGEGAPPLLRRYGYSDDDAFAVGLTCGGELDVLVQRVDPAARPELAAAFAAFAAGEVAALTRVVAGPAGLLGRALLVRPDLRCEGGLGDARLDAAAAERTRALLAAGRTGTFVIGADGSHCGEPLTLLAESHAAPPRLLVFGACDFAAALVPAASLLGYRVTVCDARPAFTTPRRFPGADEVVVDRPDRYLGAEAAAGRLDARTAVCVLTHDARFDVPVLARALRLPLGYVGAMGSRRTHADRTARLRAAGVPAAALARLRSPIGLDLGARTPQETALSITAEILACRTGAPGTPLTGASAPIHAPGGEPRSPAADRACPHGVLP